jgi:hypothetical protein
MTFRTKRPRATLDRFGDWEFVASLTPAEIEHCEAVISTLLGKILATGKIPRPIARSHVNLATSQKVWEQRSPQGLNVTLGSTRFTVSEAAGWIGENVNRLLRALRPDPGTRQPEYPARFADGDWEDIGQYGAAPAATGGLKALEATAKAAAAAAAAAAQVNTEPPINQSERRKRQDRHLKLLSKSARPVYGDDYRLGWLLYEAHKVVHINRGAAMPAGEVIDRLARSKVAGADVIADLLEAQLEDTEVQSAVQEIRGILRSLLAGAENPGPWTEKSLLWAFGVPEDGAHDPSFWSIGAQDESYRLRKKLRPITDALLATSFYSRALSELTERLEAVGFMGASSLHYKLGPLLGDSNIVGVAKFLTDVMGMKQGRMDTVRVELNEGAASDLFYWNRGSDYVDPSTILEVCELARDLTIARGAFSIQEILNILEAEHGTSLDVPICLEILKEWNSVYWLDRPGYGVIVGVSPMPALAEQLLVVAAPHSLEISDVSNAIQAARSLPSNLLSARKRIGTDSLADHEVLLEALTISGKIRRVGRTSIALTEKPEASYWEWHPVERDLVDFLKRMGGEASNREIYQHFKGDKGVETPMLARLMKILPYLWSPTSTSTAIWPWAIPKGAHKVQ